MDYLKMTDEQIVAAVREIVRTSNSDEDIQARVARELEYPHEIVITSHLPTDTAGKDARFIVMLMGGMIRSDGAMILILMHGPRGIISI